MAKEMVKIVWKVVQMNGEEKAGEKINSTQ
jgi:hypothetical protein